MDFKKIVHIKNLLKISKVSKEKMREMELKTGVYTTPSMSFFAKGAKKHGKQGELDQ